MAFNRLPARDPRTVARDIPGVFDALFPRLVPGVVAHYNRQATVNSGIERLPEKFVKCSLLSRSMLFEIAYARGEQLLQGKTEAEWQACVDIAVKRQRRHFDASIPEAISETDMAAAEWVANNMAAILGDLATEYSSPLQSSPSIPGYEWIASGNGDFAIADTLIEVKCTARHFSASDYRQLVMYWLLSYAAAVENDAAEWKWGILTNPRLNLTVRFTFQDILSVIAAGRSKVQLLELFRSIASDPASKELA